MFGCSRPRIAYTRVGLGILIWTMLRLVRGLGSLTLTEHEIMAFVGLRLVRGLGSLTLDSDEAVHAGRCDLFAASDRLHSWAHHADSRAGSTCSRPRIAYTRASIQRIVPIVLRLVRGLGSLTLIRKSLAPVRLCCGLVRGLGSLTLATA